jgi:molybdenum cofactor cytidylyltransferase
VSRIGAVVFAAGASTRLGQPKQLLVLHDEKLLERAVRIASEVCHPVIVVLGANADLIRSGCNLSGAAITVNEAWMDGMGSSIRCGLAALGTLDGVILMTCDMPAVTARHLRLLTASGSTTASAYAGRRGVPAYFPAAAFPALLALQAEGGAQPLLTSAPAVDLAFGELDIDTFDDFKRAQSLIASCA